ncbi:MAG TPA: outer membrane beta-barrel protein [Ohtaekwangia sp.]|nr:outer membrane beta-barrel protein [Ohtaekwangia sp.]
MLCCVLAKGQNQEECELVLNRATDEFNAGHFYGIPAMLNDCLNKNQRSGWRQRAYLLLAETYLLLDDPFGAERSYLEVLRSNPEFRTDPAIDPIDLVYLSAKFTATPVFTVHGKLGSNVSPVRALLTRNTFSGTTSDRYLLRPGLHLGGGVDWNYDENISAGIEINYMFTAYQYRISDVFGEGRDNLLLNDRQNWLRIPLIVKYADDEGKYRPYGYLGYSIDLMLSDRATITFTDQNLVNGEIQSIDEESPVLNFTSRRNLVNRSLLVGGGVKYKLGLDYAFVDVRYSLGLTNIVKVNSIDADAANEPAFTWGYTDNLFRLDNLAISVGYIYPLYKPRKLKKARTGSVFRKIKKQSR